MVTVRTNGGFNRLVPLAVADQGRRCVTTAEHTAAGTMRYCLVIYTRIINHGAYKYISAPMRLVLMPVRRDQFD